MPYAMHYDGELPTASEKELKEFFAYLRGIWYKEHNEDGTHNFGVGSGGHSGESVREFPTFDPNSLNFMNQMCPAFFEMMEIGLSAGLLNIDETLTTLIDDGDLEVNDIIQVATWDATEAQLEAAGTTPFTVLAAQGAGTRIHVVAFAITMTTNPAYTGTAGMTLEYTGGGTLSGAISQTQFNTAGVHRSRGSMSAVGVNQGTNNITNKGIDVSLSINPTSLATGVATAKGTIWYYLDETTG